MSDKVFAFDLGKASIGYCVREDFDIKEANSIIIEKDHAESTTNKDRRRIQRTLKAHEARENFFNKLWKECNLQVLDKNDKKFSKEFASKGEDILYTSCLLRIALLQNKKLENWQIYKALYNAFQRRGYDPNLAWKSSLSEDDKENLELIKKYTQESGEELIKNDLYKYPCCYDALRLGLWAEEKPENFRRFIDVSNKNKVRSTDYVTPRRLVEKELALLWKNAQSQIPELKKCSTEEFLYGEYREAYGSYLNTDYKRHMGTERDWQGVLGQKIPRFDNRIIAKCKLLPKRNVCKAATLENVSLVLLMQLKNLRLTEPTGQKIRLSPLDINQIYENWLVKMQEKNNKLDTTIIKRDIESVINKKISAKIEPLKANISGRSSFCRRACEIMKKVILSDELYPVNIDISEFVDKPDTKNGITEVEIKTMLSKIGDTNTLFIPDNRNENAQNAETSRIKTDIMIGNLTNPIVRNRLQIFRDLLFTLIEKHGKPDKVIFEFVREGSDNSLFGKIKAQSAEAQMKKNEKENQLIKAELDTAQAYSPVNFDKLKLLKMQGGYCIYSGKKIGISNLDECEIEHIYPRAMGGNDAFYNKVLCYRIENQKKGARTPYEWLYDDKENWDIFVNRASTLKQSLGKKKFELLTSTPEDCAKLIDSYNGLAETSHIAKLAQQITAFSLGWGLQVEGQSRHIYVNNGASTHAIRRRYGLNSLLGNDQKKNRENDKHHALDAICISFSQDFKYDKESKKDTIKDFNPQRVKDVIDSIMPYPYANDKQLKMNTKPLETIYGKRIIGDKAFITNKISLDRIEKKEKKIKLIIDEVIKNDLLEKLNLPQNEWTKMLENYVHPKKQTFVKKVLVVVSEGSIEKDGNGRERMGEYCDFGTKGTHGQFKHSKGHKGQIIYYDEKGGVKVMPVYANKKTQEVREKLISMGCKLYDGGRMFHSGCLINILNDFKAGPNTHPAGIYKLRTILGNGQIKVENSNGIEINSSATNLVNAKFTKYKS